MNYAIRQGCLFDLIRLFSNLRECDKIAIKGFGDDNPDRWAARTFMHSLALYAMEDEEGNLHGVAGVHEVRQGVVDVWAIGSNFITARSAIFAMKFLEELFNNIEKNTGVHRIECYVLRDFAEGHNAIRRLGFQSEGVRHAAGKNGEDAVVYSRRKQC